MVATGPEGWALLKSKAYETTVFSVLFVTICFIALALRYISPCVSYGIEEVFIGLAWITSLVTGIGNIKQVSNGKMGNGMQSAYTNSLEWLFIVILRYNLSLCFTKLAILLLYHRVFVLHRTRIVCNILIVFVVSYAIEITLGNIFTCLPVEASWDASALKRARCIDKWMFYVSNAALNIASDIAIVLLPIPAIYSLPLPRGQKISLMIILILGFFVCIASGNRLYALIEFWKRPSPTAHQRFAITYWTIAEQNIGIICACLPTLRPAVHKFAQCISSSRGDSRARNVVYNSNGNWPETQPYTNLNSVSNAHNPGAETHRFGGKTTCPSSSIVESRSFELSVIQ